MTGEPNGDQAVHRPAHDAVLARADSLARKIFSDVANKSAFLTVEGLGDRTLRFSELRNEIEGVSHKMPPR
ncbi:hypothetical protein GCM10022232_93070 [Streptomyces plumbiresistens]|uniref:Uncharacterized protein n=1 Tax=Streptomyces plumbiresistens TaxID=511811 RepID=A0ABP7TWZ5_9ACTN